MAADSQEQIDEAHADARLEIQDIIEYLNRELCIVPTLVLLLFFNSRDCFVLVVDELNLSEPGNTSLDGKIAQLDKIFDECKLSFFAI